MLNSNNRKTLQIMTENDLQRTWRKIFLDIQQYQTISFCLNHHTAYIYEKLHTVIPYPQFRTQNK